MGAHTHVAREQLPHWPRLMSEGMAARYVGIGTSTLREVGPQPKRIGRRVLYDIRDLDRWADRLGGQPLAEHDMKAEASSVEARFLERRRGKD